MKRSLLLSIVCLMVLYAPLVSAGKANPAALADDVIDPRLTVRQQAATFEALVKKVQPNFVWNGQDMLWIEHDGTGKPMFAMNRAYRLRVDGREAYYLFEARKDYVSNDIIDYTRSADPKPKIVARDPRRGVVYRTAWNSPVYDGTGQVEISRQLFLLCDGQHVWHFIGEGPEEGHGKNSIAEYWTNRSRVTVYWTNDLTMPLEVKCTLIHTDLLLVAEGREKEFEEIDSSSVCHDWFLRGTLPATLCPSESQYMVVEKDERREAFVRRVAFWLPLGARFGNDMHREHVIQRLVGEQLREWNPTLHEKIPAGTVVWLRGNLWKIVESKLPPRPATRPAS